MITGYSTDIGATLTSHPLVRKVAFTGGVETARKVVAQTSENLAKLSLELGGKSPQIIFEDADLDSVVNGVVAGVFAASGHSCVAGSRVLVHDTLYDAFLERLTQRAQQIKIGHPREESSEMGPIATERQLSVIESFVAKANQEKGTRLVYGGRRPDMSEGWYFQPTIFECNSPQALSLIHI